MGDLGQSGGRDLAPLSERPGYNANPNNWVRYANHLETERDRYREALDAIVMFARPPHNKIGEACGVDACCGCLIEGTAREALNG